MGTTKPSTLTPCPYAIPYPLLPWSQKHLVLINNSAVAGPRMQCSADFISFHFTHDLILSSAILKLKSLVDHVQAGGHWDLLFSK